MSKNRKPDLGQTNPFLDEAYLGGVKKKREKISLKDLSSVENARKMTLCDLVNLVNKCAKKRLEQNQRQPLRSYAPKLPSFTGNIESGSKNSIRPI